MKPVSIKMFQEKPGTSKESHIVQLWKTNDHPSQRSAKHITAIRATALSVPLSIRNTSDTPQQLCNRKQYFPAISTSAHYLVNTLMWNWPTTKPQKDVTLASRFITLEGKKRERGRKKKGVSSHTMLFQPEVFQALCKHCITSFSKAPRRTLHGYKCLCFITVWSSGKLEKLEGTGMRLQEFGYLCQSHQI